ncbi:hypothetical protein [uncultured Hyphomicrobium sp.]|uniref:lipoate--protein ligase family protein n=1 Tax=uncultured Hyphomicrobium sp. TaxID=194373 RepID=UPI0025F3F2AC|nr:hypothetical protein [uncultured Hyphomicrobium sp.]
MPSSLQAAALETASHDPLLDFNTAQTLERQLLDAAAARGAGCDWAVWRTHQSLVVPSQTANAANFYVASLDMSLRGWPVYVRDTGGDVTPQSPGVINASAAFVVPRTTDLSIRATYQRFCAPLLEFLGAHGIDAYLSSVPGAFCDGAFNIVVDGLKLAGTAQRWRLVQLRDGRPGVAVLAHAAILADPDIEFSISATNRFYRLCGEEREVDPARHTSLATLFTPRASTELIVERLSHFLHQRRDFNPAGSER